mmetsp:Transcript_13398/g.20233  ORF Transcript_13398/g.20233 Transcript_13398/m.20233 type:complete len:582 (+) Transcript_13398:116-1861(+)
MYQSLSIYILIILFLIGFIEARKITFDNTPFRVGEHFIDKNGMLTKKIARSMFTIDPWDPEISIKLHTKLISKSNEYKENAEMTLQIAIFHSSEIENIGKKIAGRDSTKINRAFCTDKEIFKKSSSIFVQTYTITKEPKNINLQFKDIMRSGIYYVLIIHCNSEQYEKLKDRYEAAIDGIIQYINPTGLLPGTEFGLLPFYTFETMIYTIASFLWIFMLIYYFKNILRIHILISIGLFIHMLESLFFSSYFSITNLFEESYILYSISTCIHIVRQTYSRTLVLIIAVGYSFIRDTLSTHFQFIYILSLIHFIASLIATIAQLMYEQKLSITLSSLLICTMPKIIVEVVFFVAILTQLMALVRLLDIRKQNTKLRHFKRFILILVLYAIACVVWFFVINYHSHTTKLAAWRDAHWEVPLTNRLVWNILELLLILSILFHFRPGIMGNIKYAYDPLPRKQEKDDETTKKNNILNKPIEWAASKFFDEDEESALLTKQSDSDNELELIETKVVSSTGIAGEDEDMEEIEDDPITNKKSLGKAKIEASEVPTTIHSERHVGKVEEEKEDHIETSKAPLLSKKKKD